MTIKVWILTVDNYNVKGYTRTEAICEFTHFHELDNLKDINEFKIL